MANAPFRDGGAAFERVAALQEENLRLRQHIVALSLAAEHARRAPPAPAPQPARRRPSPRDDGWNGAIYFVMKVIGAIVFLNATALVVGTILQLLGWIR